MLSKSFSIFLIGFASACSQQKQETNSRGQESAAELVSGATGSPESVKSAPATSQGPQSSIRVFFVGPDTRPEKKGIPMGPMSYAAGTLATSGPCLVIDAGEGGKFVPVFARFGDLEWDTSTESLISKSSMPHSARKLGDEVYYAGEVWRRDRKPTRDSLLSSLNVEGCEFEYFLSVAP